MKTMIFGELRRIFKLKAIYLLLAGIAGLLGVLSYLYGENFTYRTDYNGYGVVKYETDGLPELIANAERLLKEDEALLSESVVTASERERIESEIYSVKTQIAIYRYLSDKKIAYADYMDFAGIRSYNGDSALSAFATFAENLTVFLPFFFSLLAIWILGWDFFRGTYKFVYSSEIPRTKIVLARYSAWLILVVFGVMLSASVSAVIGFSYGNGAGKIIFANPSGAFCLNYFGLFLFETADILFRTVVIGSFVFALSLLFGNAFFPALPAAGFFIGAFFAYPAAEISPFLSVILGGFPFAFFAVGATTPTVFVLVLSGLALSVLFMLSGLYRFHKRDLK